MFKFKKKENKVVKTVEVDVDQNMANNIHTIPQRFYVAPKKSRIGLIIIVIAGVILLGGLSVAGYFLNESLKNDKTNVNANINTNVVINSNQNTNQNVNVNTNTNNDTNTNVNINASENLNSNQNANTNSNTNSNVNLNTNIDTNANTNTNVNIIEPPTQAADIDNDGLTAKEESLFNTDPDQADTDGDNYLDGIELLAGYDPTTPNVALKDSSIIETYQNLSYSIIYPASWQVKVLGDNEIIFQSSTGEFIEVINILNSGNLDLIEWYQEQFPHTDPDSITQVRINNLDGLRSADGLNYYLVDPADLTNVYVVTYNIGNLTKVNFTTTFNTMVKNFKLIP